MEGDWTIEIEIDNATRQTMMEIRDAVMELIMDYRVDGCAVHFAAKEGR